MQDLFGSVCRSLVFRGSLAGDEDGAGSRLADKIGSCIRKSRVGLGLGFIPRLPSPAKDVPAVRWRKGELIGCGAFGHVYMGMNLDSGELLAVKQVLIGTSSASKDKAQAHVRELEEEVKLLKNLSHPNIVRYLGTAREDETLNILMEFVPGGSISSLLGKFGSFPEAVIRMYTKQLLIGLDYLHENGIIHRDIKGANILVDNKGCIKLADFGASKQVAKLATMTAAKSMKGTPYWMAPEVILQTGHSFSADIWSVGCTVIEMATGKPPWSQQFQEVAALFHIGTTKSHPPIPEHLSHEAKDFLLKCLQKEPSSRPTSSDLLKHPFVSGEIQQPHHRSIVSGENAPPHSTVPSQSSLMTASSPAIDKDEFGSSTFWEMPCNNGDDDDLCQFDDKDGFNIGSSFNPMAEPLDDWPCNFDVSPEPLSKVCEAVDVELQAVVTSTAEKAQDDFTFPCGASCEDDDYEVTETKIRAFLDEKALELKKLQTPLYAFYNTLNAPTSSDSVVNTCDENISSNSKLPPKIKSSPSKRLSGLLPFKADRASTSPVNVSRRMSFFCGDPALKEIPSPKLNELTEHLPESHDEQIIISPSFSERRKKWKEELDQELERNREMMRQAAVGGRVSSPKDNRGTGQKRDRLRFAAPAK